MYIQLLSYDTLYLIILSFKIENPETKNNKI